MPTTPASVSTSTTLRRKYGPSARPRPGEAGRTRDQGDLRPRIFSGGQASPAIDVTGRPARRPRSARPEAIRGGAAAWGRSRGDSDAVNPALYPRRPRRMNGRPLRRRGQRLVVHLVDDQIRRVQGGSGRPLSRRGVGLSAVEEVADVETARRCSSGRTSGMYRGSAGGCTVSEDAALADQVAAVGRASSVSRGTGGR